MTDKYKGYEKYRPDYARIRAMVDEAITLDRHDDIARAINGLRFSLNLLSAEVEKIHDLEK